MLILIQSLLGKFSKHQAITLLVLAALFTFIGGSLFSIVEHVSFGTGIYWAITTATTVGYGDVTPKNPAGRIIAVGLMLTAIPLFAGLFAIIAALATAAQIRRIMGLDKHLPSQPYVVVAGDSPIVAKTISELHRAGRKSVVIADIPNDTYPDFHDAITIIAGSPTDESTLARAKPERASQILIANQHDSDTLVAAVLLRHLAVDVPIVAVVNSQKIAQALKDLGIQVTVSTEEMLGHILAKSLETPHASEIILRILETTKYSLAETDAGQAEIGRPISQVRDTLSDLVLGLVKPTGVLVGIGEDPIVEQGDKIIALTLNSMRHDR